LKSQQTTSVDPTQDIILDFKTYQLPIGSKSTIEFLFLLSDLKLEIRIPDTLLLVK